MRAVPIIYKRAHWPAKAEYKVQEETELEDLLEIPQLAKFIGPMAGFHRHFHRPAVGNRCRADIGFAHRRDSGPLAANKEVIYSMLEAV